MRRARRVRPPKLIEGSNCELYKGGSGGGGGGGGGDVGKSNPVPTRDGVQLQWQLEACKTVEQLNPLLARFLVTGCIHRSLSLCKLVEFLVLSQNTEFLVYARLLVELRHLSRLLLGEEDRAFSTTTTFLHNTLIRGFSRTQSRPQRQQGLLVYSHLLRTSSKPDNFTFPFLLKAQDSHSVREGRQVHAQIVNHGFQSNVFVVNTLLNMYSTVFRDLKSSQILFDSSRNLDIVSWNTLIDGYAKSGALHLARRLFDQIPEPNDVSWTCIISGYAKHGELDVAQSLFDRMPICRNTATRNALISGFARCGFLSQARRLFDQMPCRNSISWNSMISAYAQRGELELGRSLFDDMPNRDVFSWSCMISGYAQNNRAKDALQLFEEMLTHDSKIRPNEVTLMNALAACGQLAALDQGCWIHAYIRRNGMRIGDNLGAALINMYAKCGCIDAAVEVFRKLDHKNVSSWNALITGLAVNGVADGALEAFEEMLESKTRPNNITFLGVLTACCHRGLVEEGRRHLESMQMTYGVEPEMKHYGCMIDLLGRAGLLEEAEQVVRSMPMEPDVTVLGALLGACRIHGDVQVADRLCKDFLRLKSHGAGCHVLLSNIYAAAGRWADAYHVRTILKGNQIKKEAGVSTFDLLHTQVGTGMPIKDII